MRHNEVCGNLKKHLMENELFYLQLMVIAYHRRTLLIQLCKISIKMQNILKARIRKHYIYMDHSFFYSFYC